MHAVARRIVPFGGGILVGVAVLFVLPEMAEFWNWGVALAWIAGGFGVLWIADRYFYPVCPSCSHEHEHEHEHCDRSLHGFGPPLLIAASLHAALDGWSVVAADGTAGLGRRVCPGGRDPQDSGRNRARGDRAGCARIAACGAMVERHGRTDDDGRRGSRNRTRSLPRGGSVARAAGSGGGAFIYLGGHAVHGEWKRRGAGVRFIRR